MYPKDGGTTIKYFNGYKVEVRKRIYPNDFFNYCYLILNDKKICLGDPVGDLRRNSTKNTIKNAIKIKLIENEIGREKWWDITKNQKNIYDWVREQELNQNFLEKFKKKVNNISDNNNYIEKQNEKKIKWIPSTLNERWGY